MNFKKLSLASAMMATVFSVSAAEEVTFNVKANVPDSAFYVLSEGGWASETQNMTWDEAKLSLNNHNRNLLMKNTSGGIKAYLADAAVLATSSSADNIPLEVTIAGQKLQAGAANAVTILDSEAAQTEKKLGMIVSQKETYTETTRPAAGQYDGTITMMFDIEPATVTP